MKLPATKIVCTIGPASDSPSVIGELIRHGMSGARFNFSHGKHETHARAIEAVREEARRQGRHVAILQDLQGPKIRLGRFGQGSVVLRRGADFTLTPGHVRGDETICGVDYAGLPGTSAGGRILLKDGAVRFPSVVLGEERAMPRGAGRAGRDRQGVNLPTGGVVPSLTRKDRTTGPGGLGLGVDYVAFPCRSQIRPGWWANRRRGSGCPSIAKRKKPQAL
jgi:pyruvate kinase